jgi:uncharacterized membrane protein YcaP (DUF421 family)
MAIIVRAALLWLFLWVVMRALGRKELSELSAFELVLLVVMGDLIQQGVTAQDTSVTGAALAVSTFALLTLAGSYAAYRWKRMSRIIEGIPVVLIDHGRVLHQVLRIERLTLEELQDAAREQGIADLRDVRLGVLEADGTFSFLRYGPPSYPESIRSSEERKAT